MVFQRTSLGRGEQSAGSRRAFCSDFARVARWTGACILLTSACAGPGRGGSVAGPGGAKAPSRMGESGPIAASAAATGEVGEFARRLAGADLVHVDLWVAPNEPPRVRLEYLEGEAKNGGSSQAPGALVIGGTPVSALYSYGTPGSDLESSGRRRVLMTVKPTSPVKSRAAFVDTLLAELPARDAATVSIHGAQLRSAAGGAENGSLPLNATIIPGDMRADVASILSDLIDDASSLSGPVSAAVPFRQDGAGTSGAALGAEEREAFLRFIEAELLLRRPASASDSAILRGLEVNELGRLFFGGKAALGSQPEDAAARALPAALYSIHAQERGLSQPEPSNTEDRWAVPRLLALRDRIGADEFRGMLRALADPHQGASVIDFDELTQAAEAAAPDLGARWVRAWLQGPTRPTIKTQWRHDAARGRVLLRVDQLHDLAGGRAVPAFPFRLPVRLSLPDGRQEMHLLEIDKRRDLLEIPCAEVPTDVSVDPEDSLGELVDFVATEGAR